MGVGGRGVNSVCLEEIDTEFRDLKGGGPYCKALFNMSGLC